MGRFPLTLLYQQKGYFHQKKAMIKAIFFDLWDTVIYLCGSHPVVEIKKRLSLPEMNIIEFASILEKTLMVKKFVSVEDEFKELLKNLNIQATDTLVHSISDIWKKNIHNLYFPPLIEECLKELRKDFKLGLLTNTDSFPYDFVRMRYGIENYFDLTIKSFEIGCVKPETTIFKMALDNLGLMPDQVLMCGDNPANDILPAKSMGMKTLLVDTKRIFTGFGKSDYTVNTIKELVEKLRSLRQIEFDSKFVNSKV